MIDVCCGGGLQTGPPGGARSRNWRRRAPDKRLTGCAGALANGAKVRWASGRTSSLPAGAGRRPLRRRRSLCALSAGSERAALSPNGSRTLAGRLHSAIAHSSVNIEQTTRKPTNSNLCTARAPRATERHPKPTLSTATPLANQIIITTTSSKSIIIIIKSISYKICRCPCKRYKQPRYKQCGPVGALEISRSEHSRASQESERTSSANGHNQLTGITSNN